MGKKRVQDHSKRRVCYFYDPSIGNFSYGEDHPMVPKRVSMTHELVANYELSEDMEICCPKPCTSNDLMQYHSEEYVAFLKMVSSGHLTASESQLYKFGLVRDCPVFPNLYDYCRITASGTIAAAAKLNEKQTDIAINWMGGMHHAKKKWASGFCYVNDIVLGILELLKVHKRVLYVDVDVHHGDGVEEAFKDTDRVMTVSFHKYGDKFFPLTGSIDDVGVGPGKFYSVNVPLLEGITDESYKSIFVPVMKQVMEHYQPEVVVLQCGADSLYGDQLGPFNLTIEGHGDCVRFFRQYDIPLLLLGGGGYTPANVARCWAYESAIALDKDDDLNEDLPYNPYFEEFAPQYQLHFRAPKNEDQNSKHYLHDVKMEVFENLRHLSAAPSVQMQPVSEEYMLHQLKKVGVKNPRKWMPVVHIEKMPEDIVKLFANGHANGSAANGHSSSKKRCVRSDDEPGPSKDLGSDDEGEVSRSETASSSKDDDSERRSSWADLFEITPFQFLWKSSSN